MLEYIILGFLMKGETSGYDLKQWMTKTTSYFFDASFGSIYPALKRLEQKGFVNFREIVEGSKYKKVYQITDKGKEAFKVWINKPIDFDKSRHDHLVKIFFYEFLPKDKAIERIKDLIEEVKTVLNKLTAEKDEAEKKFDVYNFYYRYSTMLYGIDFYKFLITWCNDLVENLEKNPKTNRSEKYKSLE